MEQFPALSAVIQNSQIEPKEKELEVIEKEIAKFEDVSKSGMEKQKLAIENELGELKKRVEQFPALASVIQKSQIEPKEKKLVALEKEMAKLDEISKVSSEEGSLPRELLLSSAEAISKTKTCWLSINPRLRKLKSRGINTFLFFEQFNDSIVLIGPTEATFQDLSPTPMDKDPVPKVSVHGNAHQNLVQWNLPDKNSGRKAFLFTSYFSRLLDLGIPCRQQRSMVQLGRDNRSSALYCTWFRSFFQESYHYASGSPGFGWSEHLLYWSDRHVGGRTESQGSPEGNVRELCFSRLGRTNGRIWRGASPRWRRDSNYSLL